MNDQQMSNTPWSYYWWVFRLPIQADQNAANFGRYENEEAWDLVKELDYTPVDDVDGMTEIMSQLEETLLTDLPIIPLWYNGVWSQANNSVWTNWPSDEGNHIVPATWRGYWQMGALRMLDQLELAPQE
jgi:peptide/nickel transport system substrate-binding protein